MALKRINNNERWQWLYLFVAVIALAATFISPRGNSREIIFALVTLYFAAPMVYVFLARLAKHNTGTKIEKIIWWIGFILPMLFWRCWFNGSDISIVSIGWFIMLVIVFTPMQLYSLVKIVRFERNKDNDRN